MKKSHYKHSPGKPNILMGQHFLRSRTALELMINVSKVAPKDTVLEVGPGEGILTEKLLETGAHVIAVEKDPRWVEFLKEKFKGNKNFTLVNGDILKIDVSRLLPKKYMIVANLPYYITSHFLRMFLESPRRPSQMTLMVQYEVARRIVAHPPRMSLLALSVQAYGDVRFVKKIPRNVFKPKPKVDSAIIIIENISDSFFKKNKLPGKIFFSTPQKAYQQKRKKLRSSLGIDDDRRPQELTLDDWAGIVRLL